MSLTPGVRIGPYEIRAVLGAGGTGEVDSAPDTRLDRSVAIEGIDIALGPLGRSR